MVLEVILLVHFWNDNIVFICLCTKLGAFHVLLLVFLELSLPLWYSNKDTF